MDRADRSPRPSVSGPSKPLSTASSEQTNGILQLNKAVANMEQVAQSTAAADEESAAAAEELSSQTLELRSRINQLQIFIGIARWSAAHATDAGPAVTLFRRNSM